MTRTVEDAAYLLAAMAGADAEDAATRDGGDGARDFTGALRRDALQGKRLGVARNFFGAHADVDAVASRALEVLRAQGAILVDVTLPNTDKYGDSETTVLLHEFRPDLEAYLQAYAPDAPIRTMDDLIAFNSRHAAREMPFFGQEHLIAAALQRVDIPRYLETLAANRRYAREEGIDQVLLEHRLDAVVAPTGGPAWLTDYINGDHVGASFSSPAAVAGYPHVTVPAGFVRGLPVGFSFVGTAWTDAALIGMAYAYEQASLARRAPGFAASVNLRAQAV